MQIHQSIPYGLLYSVEPRSIAQMNLSEQAKHDDFAWEEHESECASESLAGHVIAFLKEVVRQ